MPQVDTIPVELQQKIISYRVPEVVNGVMQMCECLGSTQKYSLLHCRCMPNDGRLCDTFQDYLDWEKVGQRIEQVRNKRVDEQFTPLLPETFAVNTKLCESTNDVLDTLP
jgi:hypothetical protein